MPVSGLVVCLSDELQPRADALAAMEREAGITKGVFEANRLAIVLDTASVEEDRQLRDWLESLAGVLFVQVAFVGFEEQNVLPLTPNRPMPTATVVAIENGSQDGS